MLRDGILRIPLIFRRNLLFLNEHLFTHRCGMRLQLRPSAGNNFKVRHHCISALAADILLIPLIIQQQLQRMLLNAVHFFQRLNLR